MTRQLLVKFFTFLPILIYITDVSVPHTTRERRTVVKKARLKPPKGGFKILLLGSGGREFAILLKLIADRLRNPAIGEIFFAPGNGGAVGLPGVTVVNIPADNIPALLEFAKREDIYLVIVGPEDPLVMGITDEFQKAGIRIFGADKARAMLEGSKAFAMEVMHAANVPIPTYKVFRSYAEAEVWFLTQPEDKGWYVKVNGPALGKGALGSENRAKAMENTCRIMVDKEFGEAGDTIVVQEYLGGYEASLICVCSGKDYKLLVPAKDYKPVGDGNTGPMTGGMANIAPHPLFTAEMLKECEERIVKPTLAQIGGVTGVMYFGLMITADGPKVIEINMRFGDPETEVQLALLENDLFELIEAAIDGCLDEITMIWSNKVAINIALTSPGYPGKYDKGKVITLPESLPDGVQLIHAGTKYDDEGRLVTNGGRVIYVNVVRSTLKEALDTGYEVAKQVEVEGGFQYRRDIGQDCLLAA